MQPMRTPSSSHLTIEHALLGFLNERPMHGYELYQQLTSTGGLWQVWRLKQSQVYALLARIEEKGLVSAELQPQRSSPPRKTYSLTGAGSSAFAHWLASPVARGREMRIEFLAKLYFALRMGPPAADRLLERQAAACAAWLVDLNRRPLPAPQEEMFAYAVQQFRLNQVECFMAWLTECRAALSTLAADE
jgi:DNA-binding PadR family transcriptional regulator